MEIHAELLINPFPSYLRERTKQDRQTILWTGLDGEKMRNFSKIKMLEQLHCRWHALKGTWYHLAAASKEWVSFLPSSKKIIYCDSISSIIDQCTSLSLPIVILVAIDKTSNSPQEAGAGHSDFVVSTWVTNNIQSIHSRRPFRLAIALHPSSLMSQPSKYYD